MRFLPFFNQTYLSSFSPAEVLSLIEASIAPPSLGFIRWPFPTPGKSHSNDQVYTGEINIAAGTFEAQRIINHRSAFLPVIQGKIESVKSDGSTVFKLVMRLNLLVLIFMGVWSSALLVAILSVMLDWPGPGGIAPFVMLLGMVLFGSVSFWHEVVKTEAFFKNLLQLTVKLSVT